MAEVIGPSTASASHFEAHNVTASRSAPARALTLRGTGSAIENVKYLTPSTSDTPLEELKRRYWQDGVLWVGNCLQGSYHESADMCAKRYQTKQMKGLLDPAMVKRFRGDYLAFVNEGSGMLKPGTDPVDGIFSGADWRDFLMPGAVRIAAGLKDEGPFVENAFRSHKAKFYLDFKDEVARILEPFVGELCDFAEPWCLPRSLLRCAVPGGDTTPVHYDQIYLRAGPPNTITAWVPIGDVNAKDGGLIYLDRAHDIGVKYEQDFSKMNAALSDEERVSAFNRNMEKGGWLDRNAGRFGQDWNRAWLVVSDIFPSPNTHLSYIRLLTSTFQGNYEAGDVLFHTPYTVHAGAMNESKTGKIRVSTDLRFVDKTKPYDERWTVTAYDENDPNVARKACKN